MADNEILIVAGEVSGDLHAAPLVAELKRLDPSLIFFGAGGSQMETEGVDLHAKVEELAVMGFSSIPRVLPRLSRLKRDIIRRVRERRIRLAILVDYPGFNLNLAKSLKQLPNPPQILEYIAPQVWAWKPGRIKIISQVVDHLAVVFHFEEKIFEEADIPVTLVGHPLLDELDYNLTPTPNVKDIDQSGSDTNNNKIQQTASKPLLAILPGSRASVVSKHLKVMTKAAHYLQREFPDLQTGIGVASGLNRSLFQRTVDRLKGFELWTDSRRLLSEADAAIVCSGTATLEAALFNVPQVVVYRTSVMNYHIIKRLINLPYVALVNIVAGEKVVNELLQLDFTPEAVARAVRPLIEDSPVRQGIMTGYERVRRLLGEKGAAYKTAQIAYRMLRK